MQFQEAYFGQIIFKNITQFFLLYFFYRKLQFLEMMTNIIVFNVLWHIFEAVHDP